MPAEVIHPEGDLIRYLDGDVGADEKSRIEAHLASCTTCRDRISFMRSFNQNLRELTTGQLTSREPCPDAETLVQYEAGEVDKETAEHLRAHIFFCRACRDDYYSLRRLSHDESWQKIFERAKQFVIDLAKSHEIGSVVGPARIIGGQPVFALRGSQPSKGSGKVLEILIGENTYSVEVKANEVEGLACDIVGLRTPMKEPLRVAVYSQQGEELASVQSKTLGNCHFTISGASLVYDSLIFSFTLKEAEQSLLIRFPAIHSSP